MEATPEKGALLLGPDEGGSVSLRGTEVRFKVGSDRAAGASCVEFTAAPGFDTGLHVHRTLEESFYVLEGELEFQADDRTFPAKPGACVFVPPGVPHAFANRSDAAARLLLIMSPPGHDRYFVELAEILAREGPPDGETIAALRRRYDTEQLSALTTSGKELEMEATATATEREAVTRVVQLYIDGASKGDAAKLKEAFHEQAWMFGSAGGQRYDVPVGRLIELATSQPLDSEGSYAARITSIEQVGDAAIATVEEEGCWGGVSFTDFFTLAKIDGSWRIVNKTFAHTGGEMPTG